ncbi:bifunctional diaminohydroxyphosphoribosylaminopyrimidine deaminase/5-amino-6-(5-phosphoribosylamino)uracil reductase RibD [candidate division KSB1 bacterium]|nr:bifunctional diaminohydroxyphosphoribosylaminopyrimidine deaminase/5-amino-6-(5-phosphoribosylamino)uracil reductase RibD [candidate division KSB1 bacterium]
MKDSIYMRRVLQLAKKGTGQVSPNPRVGALIERDGVVLSEGYHSRFGSPHAEVDALNRLNGKSAQGATLYVNLEPCTHFGKTPPCADSIIRTGLGHVVIGIQDPNPEVAGKGINKLRENGIHVTTGVLPELCTEINRAFIKYIQTGIPYVTLKVAQSLDGRIAAQSGKSKWITGEQSRRMVHRMRKEHDAVLVGVDTVIQDDPQLTSRTGKKTVSKRIILDSKLRIPEQARVLQTTDNEQTIIMTTAQADPQKADRLRQNGVTVWPVSPDESGRVDLKNALKELGKAQIASLFVEGGSKIFSAFIQQKLFDELIVFIAPIGFGSGLNAFDLPPISKPAEAFTFSSTLWKKVGHDMMFQGRV